MKHKSSAGQSTFGERFAFARWWQSGHVRHETDNQFAEAVGRTKGAVSHWRKATGTPPRDVILAIAERTGMDAAWLLALPNAPVPPGFEEWLAIYRKGAGGAGGARKGGKAG